METINIIINGLSVIGGMLGGGVGVWILNFWKEKKTQDLSSNEQAIKVYKELVEKLQQMFKDLEEYKNHLEKDYFELRERNSLLESLIESLKHKCSELATRIAELENEIHRLKGEPLISIPIVPETPAINPTNIVK